MIVKKVSGAIGAIIQGVQLDEKLDENTFSDIYSAILFQKASYLLLKILEGQLVIHLLKG
jgi:alpha-ketoglutarate-dependent taurine dioxygenase